MHFDYNTSHTKKKKKIKIKKKAQKQKNRFRLDALNLYSRYYSHANMEIYAQNN